MIPSHWFRRIILFVFIMTVAGGILWATARFSTNPATKSMIEALGTVIFLFGFYASAPLSARFLASRPSRDAALQERLARIVASIPGGRRIFLYDHVDKEANTVGLLPRHSRIYVTTGLLTNMSDEGMRGVIAHENIHVQEHHIFATFTYACGFAVSSLLLENYNFFFAAFLLFLGLRRYCEYRADAGAAITAGRETMLTALRELAAFYPTKSWLRWFSFANAHPTLAMRIRALETGRKALV